MAIISTVADGNTSNGAIWQGGARPVAPDQARILHNVNVDTDWDIGVSPDVGSTTDAQAIRVSGGSLTFNANLTITLRGKLEIDNGYTVTVNEGCNFVFNMSGATTPSTAVYGIYPGGNHYGNTLIACNGTAQNPISFSGSHGWHWGSNYWIGYVDLTHVNITGLRGEASINRADRGMQIYTSGGACNLHHVTFDDCLTIRMDGANRTGVNTISLQNVRTTNSIPSGGNHVYILGQGNTSSTISITNSAFDETINTPTEGLTMSNVTLATNLASTTTGASTQPQSVTNCAFRADSIGYNFPLDFDMSNLYFLNAQDNVKLMLPTTSGPVTISDSVVESYGTATSDGEFFQMVDNATPTAFRCIFLPKPDRTDGCMVIGELGDHPPGTRQTIKNCTAYYRGANVGHDLSGPSPTDSISFKDTIVWIDSPNGGFGVQNLEASPSPDAARGDDLDYNCFHNIPDASRYPNMTTTVGTFGLNDLILVDPGFADPNVNLVAFSQSIGGPGSQDAAWQELERTAVQETGHNVNFTITNLLNYIRTGLTPSNIALQGAASDGGDIGAVPVAAGLVTTVLGQNVAGSSQIQFTWTEVSPP